MNSRTTWLSLATACTIAVSTVTVALGSSGAEAAPAATSTASTTASTTARPTTTTSVTAGTTTNTPTPPCGTTYWTTWPIPSTPWDPCHTTVPSGSTTTTSPATTYLPGPTPGTVLTLFSGQKLSLSGPQGAEYLFRITPEKNSPTFTITLEGGTGSAELSVRRWIKPTDFAAECRQVKDTNAVTCSLPYPAEEPYFIRVKALTAYQNVVLTAKYSWF